MVKSEIGRHRREVSFTVQLEEGLGVELFGVQSVGLFPNFPQLSHTALMNRKQRVEPPSV